MSEEKHLGNYEKQVCTSLENHARHICQMAKKVATGEIKELVESPQYICENCARVAKSDTNLCRPASLQNIPYHE